MTLLLNTFSNSLCGCVCVRLCVRTSIAGILALSKLPKCTHQAATNSNTNMHTHRYKPPPTAITYVAHHTHKWQGFLVHALYPSTRSSPPTARTISHTSSAITIHQWPHHSPTFISITQLVSCSVIQCVATCLDQRTKLHTHTHTHFHTSI